MTTFDFKEVQDFAANVNRQLTECENGEGMECANIDHTLSCCAENCCGFTEKVRKWARDVFAGRVVFDPAVEQLWKAEAMQLYTRAFNLLEYGGQAESECYALNGKVKLQAALFRLRNLLDGWVTPKLSVGPSARLGASLSLTQYVDLHAAQASVEIKNSIS